jgi:hypothetical protein
VNKLKVKPKPAIGSHSILHVCKICGWVGTYGELDLGEIGTYGYGDEPKCPRCKSKI